MQFTRSKGYLTIQATEEGYSFIFYDSDLHEIQGGDYDNPDASIQEAAYEILKSERMDDMDCVKVDYKEFEEMTIQHSKDLLQEGELRATSEIGRNELALNSLSRAEVERGVLYHAHYLPKGQLKDNVFTSMNNGRTGGIIMGNYLSLYFAENALKKISDDFETALEDASINCHFEYFSDDFYIFCNKYDNETIRGLFNQVLAENDHEGNEQKIEIEDYESYNIENLLTRYWKAIMRHWNEEVLKDFQRQNQIGTEIPHKLSFLNQLIYRLSSVKRERNKQSLIRNFFKTKHFQETDFEKYDVEEYNYHQLCFLLKMSPESLLYTSDIFNSMSGFDNQKIKIFLKARYREALIFSLHDVQLYYYYAIRCYQLDWCLEDTSDLVLKSQNQILISYYLKDGLFSEGQINSLKLLDNEKFWFQNYHLILYRPELTADLDESITKYLMPEKANTDPKKERYKKFYKENLALGKAIINEVSVVTENIQEYLEKRNLELINEDDNGIISEEEEFWI